MTEGLPYSLRSKALILATSLCLAPLASAQAPVRAAAAGAKPGVVLYVTPAQSFLILSQGKDQSLNDRSDLCFYHEDKDPVPLVCGIVNVVGKEEAVVITYAGGIHLPSEVTIAKPATPDTVAALRKKTKQKAAETKTKKPKGKGKGKDGKNVAETIIFIATDRSYIVVNAGKAQDYERGATVCVDGSDEAPGACGTVATSRDHLAVVGSLVGGEESLALGKHVSVTELAPQPEQPEDEAEQKAQEPPPPPPKPVPPPPPPPPPKAPEPPAPPPPVAAPAKKSTLTYWLAGTYTLLAKSTFNTVNFRPFGLTESARSTMWDGGHQIDPPTIGPVFLVEQRRSRTSKWQFALRYQLRPTAAGNSAFDTSDTTKIVDSVYKGATIGGFAAYAMKLSVPTRSMEGLWLSVGLDVERSFFTYGSQVDAFVPDVTRSELGRVSSQLDVLSLRTAVNYEWHLWLIGIKPELALSLPFTQLNKHESDEVYPPGVVPYSGSGGAELGALLRHRRSKIGIDLLVYLSYLEL